MAEAYLDLTDLAKINDLNLADAELTDLLDDAPMLARMAADVASNGTSHKFVKETAAPSVGFRAINTPRENKKSADTVVTADLKVLDCSFAVDKALADAYRKGPLEYVSREMRRHLRAGFFKAEQQLIYGTNSDAGGFVGLVEGSTVAAYDDAMVVDAGGSTANTGSSVWLIRTNDLGTDAMLITGNDGNISATDPIVQAVTIDGTAGRFTGYYTGIEAWLGLQVGSVYSLGRILNLTAQAGKTLTDDLIYQALALFPASRQPNLIVMNRRSLEQLRSSRTATNATGAPAPRPTEVDGYPIVVTDAITSTEAISAAA